jgi:hypothetical protein
MVIRQSTAGPENQSTEALEYQIRGGRKGRLGRARGRRQNAAAHTLRDAVWWQHGRMTGAGQSVARLIVHTLDDEDGGVEEALCAVGDAVCLP